MILDVTLHFKFLIIYSISNYDNLESFLNKKKGIIKPN
jgi:hypothetical protein